MNRNVIELLHIDDLFYPEDGSDMPIRNVCKHQPEHMASQLIRE
jgi:hypothetical protein